MTAKTLNIKKLDSIFNEIITKIQQNKGQIFEISEHARQECKVLEMQLVDILQSINGVIAEVDRLEQEEKNSRKTLLKVSKNFNHFTEQDILTAYESAKNLQIELVVAKQKEKELIQRRNDLEIRLKSAKEIVKKADNLSSQVGVALDYLSGNLNEVWYHIDDIQKRQDLGVRIIKAQEEERNRVAREIHDGPAQSMANVIIKAELCERLLDIDKDKAKVEFQGLKQVVKSGLQDIRKIIFNLKPMSLDDLGLVPTLERYISDFNIDSGINIDFKVKHNNEKIDSVIQLTIFRIIQECLNNIKKHSKATYGTILLEISKTKINCLITDNGLGFDIEEVCQVRDINSGFGLINMKERAQLLNGKVEINSTKNRGTRILASIPQEKNERVD